MKKRNLVLFGTTAMLSLALAGTIGAVTASAAELSNGGETSGSTTVSYQVADSWKVTIPQEITIGGEEETKVEATEVKIEQGKNLKVTVESTNGWKVKASDDVAGDHALEYELKKDGTGSAYDNDSNNEVLSVEAGATGSTNLKASLKNTGDSKYSTGNKEYTDTLTFTVAVA